MIVVKCKWEGHNISYKTLVHFHHSYITPDYFMNELQILMLLDPEVIRSMRNENNGDDKKHKVLFTIHYKYAFWCG